MLAFLLLSEQEWHSYNVGIAILTNNPTVCLSFLFLNFAFYWNLEGDESAPWSGWRGEVAISVCPPAPPGPRVLLPLLLLPRQDGGEVSQGLGETLKLPPRRFLPTGVSASRCHQSAPVIGAGIWPQGDSGPTTQP